MTTSASLIELKQTMTGSCCILLSTLLSAVNNTIIKISGLRELQILLAKYVIQLIIAVTWWNIQKPSNDQINSWYGDFPNVSAIWLRGITYSIGGFCYFYGIIRLPIGDSECIILITPIVITIMARIFLKEVLPKYIITMILCAVISVIFVS